MLTAGLERMLNDGPTRAALALWVVGVATFTVSVYPIAHSYSGVGEGFELFDGLRAALLIGGAASVPWLASRILWIERGSATTGGGPFARALAAGLLVLLLLLLALPFVIVAYRTGAVGIGAAVLTLAETALFLCLLAILTLLCTAGARRFLLSLAAAYGITVAAVASIIALGRFTASLEALAVVTSLNALALFALARRGGDEPLTVPS